MALRRKVGLQPQPRGQSLEKLTQLAEYLIIARRRPTLIRQQPQCLPPGRRHRVLVNRGRIRRGQARTSTPG
jgi:hypothetical protein